MEYLPTQVVKFNTMWGPYYTYLPDIISVRLVGPGIEFMYTGQLEPHLTARFLDSETAKKEYDALTKALDRK